MLSEKRVSTGLVQFDKKLDYIRTGDNMVFRVINLEYFRYVIKFFLKDKEK